MSEVEKLCDSIAIIHGGRILAEGALAQLRATDRRGAPGGHFHQSRGGTRLNLRPIAIVYRKELRDLLRDWRTIMSMIIVPVVVVPAHHSGRAQNRQS
jgi:ABC-type multidrug transport system ATPase subunit